MPDLHLDLAADPVELCAALVDVPSVSGSEAELADALERALREQAPHLQVLRSGDAVLARTRLDRAAAGAAGRPPGHRADRRQPAQPPRRAPAARLRDLGHEGRRRRDRAPRGHRAEPRYDLTLVFYDCEEVEASPQRAGPDRARARRLAARRPGRARGADQRRGRGGLPGHAPGGDHPPVGGRTRPGPGSGTTRCTPPAPVLERLTGYPRAAGRDRRLPLPGGSAGGAHRRRGGRERGARPLRGDGELPVRAGPRPRRRPSSTSARCFDGFELAVTDCRGRRAARAAARRRPASSWRPPGPSRRPSTAGPTSSRFAALGIPALNFGPGDPNLAHTREEHVDTRQITAATELLRRFLTG